MDFVYTSVPVKVSFGAGNIGRVAQEVSGLGKRALVLTTPEQRDLGDKVLMLLGEAGSGAFNAAQMHVPVEVVDKAELQLTHIGADCLVAVGGGSTIGLAKALALRTGFPILAIPTTYAGSEMTPIWGLTENGQKRTGRNDIVRPKSVLYDPDLTAFLPAGLAVTSGMNAIAHCCEALYASDANPLTTLMAQEGISAMAGALRSIAADPNDIYAREQGMYGAWLGGTVLGLVSMALHHKLCHTLGGLFNLPHAELHTALLPHSIAYNAPNAAEAVRKIAVALGIDNAAHGLYHLASGLGAPMALSALGMPEDGIDHAVQMALAAPYPNPRPLEAQALTALLRTAYNGELPRQY